MFCFSCKYFDKSPVKKTVDAILKFHPNEKIVIVDSMSDDKSYYDIFVDYDNVDILDNCNPYRVPGAFYQTIKKYPNEPYYVNIQDSLIIKKSWQEFIDKKDEIISLGFFHDTSHDENSEPYQFMKKSFEGTSYSYPKPGEKFKSCFGPIYIIKNSSAKKLYNSGILANLKSTCKMHDEMWERIFGILATAEGYDPEYYNMEGDIVSKWNEMMNDRMEYYTKFWGHHHGRT